MTSATIAASTQPSVPAGVGVRARHGNLCRRGAFDRPLARRELGLEGLEEIVGDLARGGVDQARADLRDLAADRGAGAVGELRRRRAFGRELHVGRALAEAGDAALPVEDDRVAVRRVDVGHLQVAPEAGTDRADLHRHHGRVGIVAGALERFAAGDAGLQCHGIVERGPGRLERGRNQSFAVQFHR